MASQGYEEVDHTADIALRVWGDDFHTLLSNSAKGMYDLMGIRMKPDSHIENEFQIVIETLETVLVDFLSEVLFFAEDPGQIYDSFSFKQQEGALEVHARGHEIETIHRNIKAVTFHDLEIEETEKGLETTITFDV